MPADPEPVTDDDLTSMVAEVVSQSGFTGVVRVDRGGWVIEFAAGAADRATGRPMATTDMLALASGTKSLTAMLIATLIDEGRLRFDSPTAPLVGRELPLIDPAVTVEHLLTHRSGIADYLGDDTGGLPAGYLPADLATTTDYLPLLAGLESESPPGERFSYCSAGFVILAYLAEQVTGQDFHTLVRQRVIGPAGLTDSDFLRSDALPDNAALGYLEDGAPNTGALPVIGSGDGGSYSTVADIRRWWEALYAGRVVAPETLRRLTTPVSERPPGPAEPDMYACGFWVYRASRRVAMEGYDTGVSFRSVHDPATDTTYTVIGTTSAAAWPVAAALESVLAPTGS